MRVVALLAARNEELYLERCLEHLSSQGVETCLIDNGSTDRTLDIAKSFFGRGVFRIDSVPYKGFFELRSILDHKEKLAEEIEADWFIHHDADEIREAPKPYRTLVEGIEDADRQGYNAINFDEFTFLPANEEQSFEGKDYVKEMRSYYYFLPQPMHRINLWKKTGAKVNLKDFAGHRAEFAGRKIFPVNFILRHYIFLSKNHALTKYLSRVYSKDAIAKGWHKARAKFSRSIFTLPQQEKLKILSDDNNWDRSTHYSKHLFLNNSNEQD